MKLPEEEILRAIVNLQGSPNWEKVVVWLRESRDQANMTLYENTVFNAGRAAELQDLIQNIDTAREKHDEIQRQRNLGQIK